jgi:hypothetical protein
LEVADPEDEFGDGGGAGVDLEAEELVRIDGLGAGEVEECRPVSPKLVGAVEHLAFEALDLLEGDVEEVAGAAGGVEDAEVEQRRSVEGADGGAGLA